jgi:DNA-3-methyladenine glycosylase
MGVSLMALNRYGRNPESDREKFNLTNGPGKVCRALSIDNQHYGIDLTGNKIYLLEQPEINNNQIVVSKRIGIKKSVDLPWRFYIKDNPYVSRR